MFTGIVQEVGKVISALPEQLVIAAQNIPQKAELGESIAVNGVCLTVMHLTGDSFSVGVMPETLRRSNLGLLQTGSRVNLEPAMTLGGKMGGHLVEGHVDATGKVAAVRREGGAILVEIEAPPEVMRYVVEKGFIAIDGVSLTVSNRSTGSFWVSIVQYTRQHTILEDWRVGTTVNLEADIIAKYVEQLTRVKSSGITEEFMREHGFTIT